MFRHTIVLPLAAACCLGWVSTAVRAASPRDSLMTDSTWLASHLKDPNLVILTLGVKATYDAGHIPGAQFITMDAVSAPMDHSTMDSSVLSLEMPDAAWLRDSLQKLGISNQSKIVVSYSDGYFSPSTRVIFALNYAGLGANTVLLEGGLRAWKAGGHATTTDVSTVAPGTLAPLTPRKELIVDAQFIQTTAKTRGFALVDGRETPSYEGVMQPNARDRSAPVGHIPGAMTVSFENVFNDREQIRPAAELEALFTQAGVKPGDTVVGYCWVGQRATAMLFAARLLGHEVRLYDGSINDWTNRKLPLEVVKKDGSR